MYKNRKDKRLRNSLTLIALIIFLILLIRNFILKTPELAWDIIASAIGIFLFHKYYKRMHQDYISYSFFIFALLLHNLGLYASSPFGIRFDHYMHFVAGFSIALIGDRLLVEKISSGKKFILLLLFSLGIGAIGEILEWLGYAVLGFGPGFFRYGIGDEGEWRNAIFDLVFNSFGAVIICIWTLLRKRGI
jgi:uncharacterized membrane protein YjdF